MSNESITKEHSLGFKFREYLALGKLRLSFFVVLSAIFGYLVGMQAMEWGVICNLGLGGLLITISSNTLNQIFERDTDALMLRTSGRPLPQGHLSVGQAEIFALITGILGFALLYVFVDRRSAILALLSLVLYAYVYTPMKRKTSFSVFVGAIPGAFPPLIGYLGATHHLDAMSGSLFAIQFFWQFPHFWAIAWLAHDDYQRAGIHLLPSSQGRDNYSAWQIVIYTFCLIPVSILPFAMNVAGYYYLIASILLGTIFLIFAFRLLMNKTRKNALALMFASFFYLPLLLGMLFGDKTI